MLTFVWTNSTNKVSYTIKCIQQISSVETSQAGCFIGRPSKRREVRLILNYRIIFVADFPRPLCSGEMCTSKYDWYDAEYDNVDTSPPYCLFHNDVTTAEGV